MVRELADGGRTGGLVPHLAMTGRMVDWGRGCSCNGRLADECSCRYLQAGASASQYGIRFPPPLCEQAFEDPDELEYGCVVRGQLVPVVFRDKASSSMFAIITRLCRITAIATHRYLAALAVLRVRGICSSRTRYLVSFIHRSAYLDASVSGMRPANRVNLHQGWMSGSEPGGVSGLFWPHLPHLLVRPFFPPALLLSLRLSAASWAPLLTMWMQYETGTGLPPDFDALPVITPSDRPRPFPHTRQAHPLRV